jgi:hypothetical protein
VRAPPPDRAAREQRRATGRGHGSNADRDRARNSNSPRVLLSRRRAGWSRPVAEVVPLLPPPARTRGLLLRIHGQTGSGRAGTGRPMRVVEGREKGRWRNRGEGSTSDGTRGRRKGIGSWEMAGKHALKLVAEEGRSNRGRSPSLDLAFFPHARAYAHSLSLSARIAFVLSPNPPGPTRHF